MSTTGREDYVMTFKNDEAAVEVGQDLNVLFSRIAVLHTSTATRRLRVQTAPGWRLGTA